MSEKVLGVNLNYWLMYFSASYYVTPRFAPKIYLRKRVTPDGLRYPEDFTDDYSLDDFDNEWFYNHDRTIKHDYLDAGVGFDYVINERYVVSGAFYKTVKTDNVARVDYAFTFGLTRNF